MPLVAGARWAFGETRRRVVPFRARGETAGAAHNIGDASLMTVWAL